MIRRVLRKRDLKSVAPATMFLFQPGDLVLQRAKAWNRGSKLAAKAHGPYRVVAVKGLLGQRGTVERTEDGKKRGRPAKPREVHTALLVPYAEGWQPTDLIYDEPEPAEPVVVIESGPSEPVEGIAGRVARRRYRRR